MSLPLEHRLLAQDGELSAAMLTRPKTIEEIYLVIKSIRKEIRAGERIQVKLPRSYTHDLNGEHCAAAVQNIQDVIHGGVIGGNTFATLRNDKYPSTSIIVDICCIA